MNTNIVKRKNAAKMILPVVLVTMMASASVMAKPFWSDRGPDMINRFEHMLEHLDLNEDQEKQVEVILTDLKDRNEHKRGHQEIRSLISLNPEEIDYLEKVHEHADRAAEQVKTKIVEMAKVKQALYNILDEKQKAKMAKMIDKRLSKLDKRMQENDED